MTALEELEKEITQLENAAKERGRFPNTLKLFIEHLEFIQSLIEDIQGEEEEAISGAVDDSREDLERDLRDEFENELEKAKEKEYNRGFEEGTEDAFDKGFNQAVNSIKRRAKSLPKLQQSFVKNLLKEIGL